MTRRKPTTSVLRSAALLAALCSFAPAQVELRGGAFIDQPVESVSAAGVALAQTESAAPRTLGWHQVKRVGGDFADEAEAFARLSEDLWRATSRLERGDAELAAPIFERLWAAALDNETDPHTVAGVRLEGPTGLAIASGAARVRIAEQALAEAVEPWAAAIALRGEETIEAGSLLLPDLPPIFVRSVAVERLAATEPAAVVQRDPRASALFALYRRAAAIACDDSATLEALDEAPSDDVDLRFVCDLVDAQHPDAASRAEAAARLREAVRKHGGEWREAWSRAALGIAAAQYAEGRDRLSGTIDLIHVPARFAGSQPYLAGVSLGWAIAALRAEGDTDRAALLREELELRYPFSPAIGWLSRRSALGGEL